MLLYISFANIIISIVLMLFGRQSNRNNIFLALLLICMSIHGISFSFLMERGPILWIAIFYNNFSPIYFLIGPFLYLYLRGTLKDTTGLVKKDWIHFLPALIIVVNIFPYWFSPFSFKLETVKAILNSASPMKSFDTNWLIPSDVNFIVRAILFLYYIYACVALLIKRYQQKSHLEQVSFVQEKVTYRWLVILVSMMFCITLGYTILSIIYITENQGAVSEDNVFFSWLNFFVIIPFLLIPITLLAFPQILYGIPFINRIPVAIDNESQVRTIDSSPLEEKEISAEIENTREVLLNEPFLASSEAIMQYMEEKKPYLNKDFSIDELARAIGLPRHHIYYCMNRVLKTTFPDLRKKFRIEHAKKLLEEGENSTLSIEGIGYQSGFSSRSNFFTAFKAAVGCTPTEYLNREKSSKQDHLN